MLLYTASRAAPALVLWPTFGCGDDADAPSDAGARDAGGAAIDAGDATMDAGGGDGGRFDANMLDAARDGAGGSLGGDAATSDAAPEDAGSWAPPCEPLLTPPQDFFPLFGGDGTVENWQQPQLDAASWRLSIAGLVREPLSLSLAELEADVASQVSVLATLECLFGAWGSAIWTGIPVRVLLDRAGIDHDRTRRVRFRGADDFYDSLRLEALYAERVPGDPFEPLVAFRIAGVPLPPQLGFPARLLLNGWLGFKNIKWLSSIEASDSDEPYSRYQSAGLIDEDALAPLQTRVVGGTVQSVPAGMVTLCGRALSGTGGIERIELSIDGAQPAQAQLPSLAALRSATPEIDRIIQVREPQRYPFPWRGVWTSWQYSWEVAPGDHTIVIRVVDTTGAQRDALTLQLTATA